MLLNKRDVVSLSEWKRLMEAKEIESGVLFCPFVGLLAKSGLEAHMSTLNSFRGSGDGCEWANLTGGILADSMGLGKTVEVGAAVRVILKCLVFVSAGIIHPFSAPRC
jgi:SNF2 family DNA or RNA helicase